MNLGRYNPAIYISCHLEHLENILASQQIIFNDQQIEINEEFAPGEARVR